VNGILSMALPAMLFQRTGQVSVTLAASWRAWNVARTSPFAGCRNECEWPSMPNQFRGKRPQSLIHQLTPRGWAATFGRRAAA
jgi:hypothetical protein